MTFYNDNEPYVQEWLKNLIAAKQLSAGDVNGESIRELEGWQVAGYERCHFFAGIGGWDYALRIAGWPMERPVWTGSCPCQPFSVAGKRKGTSDERHLWPEFFRLIGECQPPTIFGEQVASRDGREWLAGIFADLESLGYAVAGADLCAAGVGAPHIRQRLYWGARIEPRRCGNASGLDNAKSEQTGRAGFAWQDSAYIPCLDGKTRRIEPGLQPLAHGIPARVGKLRAYGNAIVPQVAAEFIKACLQTI